MDESIVKIINTVGTLSETKKGWKKELNIISWSQRDPKYDIREWSPDHEKMGKGSTLTFDELIVLKDLLEQEIARVNKEEK